MEENMRNTFQKLMGRAATSARRNYLSGLSASLRSWKSNAVAWKSSVAKFGSVDLKKRSREGLGLGGLLWKNFSKAANFSSADLRSAKFGRLISLGILGLSLTLAGCDTGGGSSGGDSGGTPTCTGDQILQDGSCEACTALQYPNADRTACVTTCDDGELKPANKPTCEEQVTCTGNETYNPADNTCIDLECSEGEVANTTVNPLACISKADCQGTSHSPTSILGNACITDKVCQDMAGHVAQDDGVCQECTGTNNVRNVDKTECITAMACHAGNSSGPNSLLGTDCITDAACMDLAGHVAQDDGVCQECAGTNNVRNVDKRACITAAICHQNLSTNPNSILGTDCITDAACMDMENHVAQHDGVCMECSGQTAPNAATGMCENDSDNDGLANSLDTCPSGATGAATGSADAATADPDGDGCKNSEDADDDNDGTPDTMDVDDDNDGLIEIATAQELHNMRYNLAGTSYDDEEADDTTGDAGSTLGAPDAATANCDTATSDNVFLCGYELVADIDLSESDQNGDTAGNFDPIGSDQNNSRFTAQLEGNGHSISNLDIDRIASAAAANDHTNDAGLFASCGSAGIRNLTLAQPTIKGRRYVGALCGNTNGTRISNAHIAGGAIQGDSSSTFRAYLGGLVGWATRGQITGSRASANVSGGGEGGDYMGGLVGHANVGRITGSRANGNVSDGGAGDDRMGGLVGWANNTSQIVGSGASGNVFDGGAGDDRLGGLLGWMETAIVRDSLSLGSLCDGVLTEESCAAGDGNDNIGILIGHLEAIDGSEFVYNLLGTGLARGHSGDHIGFLGVANYDSVVEAEVIANVTNNRFDTEASGVTAKAGRVPDGVMASNLTGIVGADTAATQSATAYDSTWLGTRWLFAAGAYPRLLYFNFDPDNPTTENPSSETTIDVCETITDNDPLEDEGESDKPDCGDVLEAWPREE